MARWLPCLLLALVLGSACAKSPAQDVASSGVMEASFVCKGAHHTVMVLVVDTVTFAGNSAFQATVKSNLDAWAEGELQSFEPNVLSTDESVWHPIDWTFVVVSARSTGPARFVGPNEHPELRLETNQVTLVSATAAVDAALSIAVSDQATGPFTPIQATADLLSLIRGDRTPESPSEEALLGSLSGATPWDVRVGIVSGRDDEGTGDVAGPEDDSVLLEARQLNLPCDAPAFPRLAEWYGPEVVQGRFRICGNPGDPSVFQGTRLADVSGSGLCTSRPVATGPDGTPKCLVYALVHGSCDPTRGLDDPVGSDGMPQLTNAEDGFGGTPCLMRKVAASAQVACETDPACPSCGSGFCFATPSQPSCMTGQYPLPIRLVGGACSNWDTRIMIQCELTEPWL